VEGAAGPRGEQGLRFSSSPFSKRAVEMLRRVGVDTWKVASGEISNPQLFPLMAETGLPVMFRAGMSSWPEIDGAVERLERERLPYVLLQCTSVYRVSGGEGGVECAGEFRRRYGCAVGLSDHSGTIIPRWRRWRWGRRWWRCT
jgi:N-acetylneuraminate synthase